MTAFHEHVHHVVADEIDDLGHAGNYHYIRWLQDAAVAHSDANGWPAERYTEMGAGWVVRSHRIVYLRPAFEGDRLVIRIWVADLGGATSLRRYEIRNQHGELLAEASTDWAFTDYARQRAMRIPTEVANDFTVLADGPA